MNCLSLEFFLHSFLGPLLIAENRTTKPWQEGTIVNTTTCMYLHLGTQHITSSSLFLLMLPRSITSYLVGDLRTPPPNRDDHRCLRGKQRCGSSSEWPLSSSCLCLIGKCSVPPFVLLSKDQSPGRVCGVAEIPRSYWQWETTGALNEPYNRLKFATWPGSLPILPQRLAFLTPRSAT